ncbi:MAG: hypothetical protein WA254_13785 [Candidatus Sulfotelmatobacter sp.]
MQKARPPRRPAILFTPLSCHGFFPIASGIFLWFETHLTNPGAGVPASLDLVGLIGLA